MSCLITFTRFEQQSFAKSSQMKYMGAVLPAIEFVLLNYYTALPDNTARRMTPLPYYD